MRLRDRVALKVFCDYCIILITLPIWSVIMVVVAMAIKISRPNESVFFKQKRIGRFCKPFDCYKFRSMCKHGNEILIKYLKENPDEVEHYKKYHKYKNDPRITRVGHFIRKTSLDELPQLFNILKLDMSLVGPRPYMISEKKKIGKNIVKITSVRPGLTGLWQVSGRNDISFKERVEMDVEYVENVSIIKDILIIFKTVFIIFKN